MNTFTRALLLAALTTASGFFAACSDKKDEPTPADPNPTFRMGSYFDFVTTTPSGGTAHSGFGSTHSPLNIKGKAALTLQVLTLDFDAGNDNVYFEVDRAKLLGPWLGTYALRCRNRPTDPVFTSYVRKSTGGSSIYRFSDFTPDLTGNVVITAYDAKRQLMSGTYEVRAPEQRDPTASSTTAPTCTILIAGDFENLKVQPQ